MYDKLIIFSNPRCGSTWAYNTFNLYDNRLKFNKTMPYLYGNEALDHHTTQELVDRVSKFQYHVAKIHWRHVEDNPECQPYVDLFDRRILLLRRNLFEASLSLSISLKKNAWGVRKKIDDKPLEIAHEFFDNAVRTQWQNIRKYFRNSERLGIQDVYWLEDYKTDNELWTAVTSTALPDHQLLPHRKKAFNTMRSPDKQSVVINYNQVVDWYNTIVPTLGKIHGLGVRGELIHEI